MLKLQPRKFCGPCLHSAGSAPDIAAMTLIMSLAMPGLIAQVSDRQVTRRQPGRPDRIHSPVENKTIIFLVPDAVGVMSYTGSAYVEGIPTDEWLARKIAPSAFSGPEGMAISLGGARRDKLKKVLWRLRKSLASGALRTSDRLGICAVGFRIRRHRWVSFLAEFGWPNTFLADSLTMRRPISRDADCQFSAIGDPFPDAESGARLQAAIAADDPITDQTFVQALARVVRARAEVSDLVGPNLMAVSITQPRLRRRVDWEFIPAEPHFAELITPTEARQFPAVFSPWVISPGMLARPSFGTGHMAIRTCDWTIARAERDLPAKPLKSVGAQGTLYFAMDTQERATPPC